MKKTKEKKLGEFEKIRDRLAGVDENIRLADGFEEALIGEVSGWFSDDKGHSSQRIVALYDHERCIQILVRRDGMTREEAFEHMDFNVTGAYIGGATPAFATIMRRPIVTRP